jgi:hypothetical protein
MLLARRAQQNGVVISDRAINEFLEQITQQKLTRDDLAAISNEMKINQSALFEGLKTRLAARSMRTMFLFGLANAPPAQKWEYYLRLNRRARAEMVAVPVASFVDDVKMPDDKTISAFFEEHKDEIRRPGSPEPGFKQPHEVALQYFKADYEQFMDEDAITQEEIEAHYEQFKDTRYLFTEPLEEPAEEDAEGDKPADSPSNAPKSDTKNEAEKADTPKSKDQDKPADAENEKPAADDSDNKSEPAKADDKPQSEEKANDSKSDENKSEENTDSQADASKSDDASCSADEQNEANAETQTADKPAEPAAEKSEKPAATEADGAKSTSNTDDKRPATNGDKPADENTAAADEAKQPSLIELTGELSLPRSIRDGPRPKHNPLWRVEKDIRRELAGQKASEKIQEVFRQIKPVLDSYYDTYNAWKADHPDLQGDAEHPRPPRPDFAELAKKHGLTAHETGLLSLYEVTTETDVGQALADMAQRLQRPNYVEAVLQTPPLYKAFNVQDLPGNQYLYWKVNDVAEHVPTLTEEGIRDQVVGAWKEIQARDLAQKKADELAKQVRGGKTPSELVADNDELKLIETQPFTWMTAGNPFLGPSQPRLTDVPGLENPGNDFMQAVFGLGEGETAVTFNAPKSVAYVVRVTSLEPSLNVLRETFAVESPRQAQNFFALAQADNFEATRKWLEDVREDAGLHWNRPAHELAMSNQ